MCITPNLIADSSYIRFIYPLFLGAVIEEPLIFELTYVRLFQGYLEVFSLSLDLFAITRQASILSM
ncbi:hypothetical protein C5469_15735 [Photorhabdus cinerea]|uniref:Uncharacterized protein n=1 Tax=Photorhabdus cinerea TaxID=471575 RepID=A0A7X5TJ29_9GAMM|nr:hypothetical protein [Photorhabdus cinerea]